MKCPGQDTQYWKPSAIYEAPCPKCGTAVEFFKDDTARRCDACGFRFPNPKMDFGCAAYCKYAAQCIGDLPPEALAQQENLLKDRVAVEMKKHYGKDFKRIGHAIRVARYAERIGRAESGENSVILIAAYLKDIGSSEGSSGDSSAARALLEKLGANPEMTERVCQIIDSQRDGGHAASESVESAAVHDAELLAVLEAQQAASETASPETPLAFKTGSGHELAKAMAR